MRHAPLRRFLSWRPSGRRGKQTGETEETLDRGGSLPRHDLTGLGHAVAADREAIETRLGKGRGQNH